MSGWGGGRGLAREERGVAESSDVSPVLVRDFGSLPRLRKPNMASRFKINQTDQIVKFCSKKSLINAFWGD